MAITPLPTNIQDGDPGTAAVFNGWFSTINSNFVEVGSGGGGGSGPFLSVQSDAFGAVGDGTTDDTAAIQAALDAAVATSGTVWFPAGTYKITATLEVPNGVSILGPGATLCVIETSAAIVMMTVGSYPGAGGDRYGTVAGFALDGNDTATVGLDLIKVCVQRNFRDLEVRDINGIGYRLDAAQNCMFEATHVRGCDTGWAILNDAGTNTWINFEIDDSAVVGMLFDDDNTLGGYALAPFAHLGPCQNTFIGGLFERGTMVKGLDIVKGRYNKFYSCYFTNNSSQDLQYQLHLRTDALANYFTDCQFNGQSAAVSGYEDFDYAVFNEGFRNHLIRPTFEFASLGTGYVVNTTASLFVQHPQLSTAYKFKYSGGADFRRDGICITPLPSQAVGTTAQRPDFGPQTSPWPYMDTTVGHTIWWDGDSFEDPIGAAGGGGGATNLTRTLSATQVVVNSDTGTDATIPAADTTNAGVMTKAMFDKLNGIATSADVTNASNVDAAGAVMNTDTSTAAMSFVVDEDNMVSDSATKVPTQQSVKAYVTTAVAGAAATVSDGDKGDITVASGVWSLDNNTVTKAKLADDAVGVDELDTGGTPSGSTFLRGDMTWATPVGGGSGISNVVDDTTPELGGDLDVNGHNVGAATPADLTKLHALAADATELNYVDGVTSAIQTQLNGKQPLDTDLTTIAGLTATTDNIIQSVAGAWASRTPAQVKTALALNNVDNTSDTAKWAAAKTLTSTTLSLTSNTVTGSVAEFNTALQSADFYTTGGTDVAVADGGTGVSTLTGIVKGNGTSAFSAAAAGTDYVAPGGALGTPSSGTLTNCTGLTTSGVAAASLTTVSETIAANDSDTQIPTTAAVKHYADIVNVDLKTANYSLVAGDRGKGIGMNVASANTITLPSNATAAITVGSVIPLFQYGAGQTTIVQGSGATVRAPGGKLKFSSQYSQAMAWKVNTNEWMVTGDLTA